ncbi:hypothetical protein BQ8794_290066 [Mesorhizobium prunaredense]|uniref:Uncharacterized protein n=1 Tax=Mesorhizobium prunaredense TaxID=1631249 RepID=A0A1R3V986_9HYPH|nr:hypothetical protein BQ8794_290066 [Mesorhizobium prunaredense]
MYGRAGAELPSARMLPIHVLNHHTNEEDSYKGLAEG